MVSWQQIRNIEGSALLCKIVQTNYIQKHTKLSGSRTVFTVYIMYDVYSVQIFAVTI